jgi:hypothetical protein
MQAATRLATGVFGSHAAGARVRGRGAGSYGGQRPSRPRSSGEEHFSPKEGVAGSNPAGGTHETHCQQWVFASLGSPLVARSRQAPPRPGPVSYRAQSATEYAQILTELTERLDAGRIDDRDLPKPARGLPAPALPRHHSPHPAPAPSLRGDPHDRHRGRWQRRARVRVGSHRHRPPRSGLHCERPGEGAPTAAPTRAVTARLRPAHLPRWAVRPHRRGPALPVVQHQQVHRRGHHVAAPQALR